uniref:PID domain-containing protein n=1 Tax=Globodera rostochiensis TaxID=31243 RepID=A0A914I8T9_GLORO
MGSSAYRFAYLGSFPFNDNLGQGLEHLPDNTKGAPLQTIEEQLIDAAEIAQLSGELTRANGIGDCFSSTDTIELRLLSGSLQFVHSDSPIPFERIPIHKIKHIVSFENGGGVINVLLVESFAYSPDHRVAFVNRCHLFQPKGNGDDDDGGGSLTAKEFCKKLQQKFEDIQSKLTEQPQK